MENLAVAIQNITNDGSNAAINKALIKGFSSRGYAIKQGFGDLWAGFGSVEAWDQLSWYIKSRKDWYYVDHSYFDSARGSQFRITKNAMQVSYWNNELPRDYKKLGNLLKDVPKQWRTQGSDIVICAQSEKHYNILEDRDWLGRTIKSVTKYSDRPLVIRKPPITTPLEADLKNAWCVVTHSSCSAIAALLNGVPVITTGDSCSSFMGLSDPMNVENPKFPEIDRIDWLAMLAAHQWTLEEIKKGAFLDVWE